MSLETIVFQIEFKDGRVIRVFCANSTQKKKVLQSYDKIKDKVKEITTITNGVYTFAQYEKFITMLNNPNMNWKSIRHGLEVEASCKTEAIVKINKILSQLKMDWVGWNDVYLM